MNRSNSELKRKKPLRQTGFKPSEPKPPKGPRQRKCAICREMFTPRSMTHKACKDECAIALIARDKDAKHRKVDRERKQALKTRQDWLREAQAAFNTYIRERDRDQPCISCGRFHDGSYDAGHYRSVGAQPGLRFEETNCHKQCVPCNQHKAGNIVEYRIRLIDRIGQLAVDWLEMDHPPLKLDIESIKELKAIYQRKTRELKAQRGTT